jgi:hypothetical protein
MVMIRNVKYVSVYASDHGDIVLGPAKQRQKCQKKKKPYRRVPMLDFLIPFDK